MQIALALYPWQAIKLPAIAASTVPVGIQIPFKPASKIVTAFETLFCQANRRLARSGAGTADKYYRTIRPCMKLRQRFLHLLVEICVTRHGRQALPFDHYGLFAYGR